jgi:excisionase family DNA binding protein
MELTDRLVSIETVAEALAISKRSAYRVVSDDHAIPFVKVRGSLRVRLSDLNAYIAQSGAAA